MLSSAVFAPYIPRFKLQWPVWCNMRCKMRGVSRRAPPRLPPVVQSYPAQRRRPGAPEPPIVHLRISFFSHLGSSAVIQSGSSRFFFKSSQSRIIPRGNMKVAHSANHRGLPRRGGLWLCIRRPRQLYGPRGMGVRARALRCSRLFSLNCGFLPRSCVCVCALGFSCSTLRAMQLVQVFKFRTALLALPSLEL